MRKAANAREAWEKIPRRAAELLRELSGDQVKLWLAYRLNQFGSDMNCYPSSERLSRKTGLSVDAVVRNRKELFAKGWLWYMGLHRRKDGTFSGRTLECRAVVPEGEREFRIINAPPQRQRRSHGTVVRGNNGRFTPKAAVTDDGRSPLSDVSPMTVRPPLTDNGFSPVTDDGAAPSGIRPFEEDIVRNEMPPKGKHAADLPPSSSSPPRREQDGDDERSVVAVSSSSKKESPATGAKAPATLPVSSSENARPNFQSGMRPTKRPAKEPSLTDGEVLTELEDHFRMATGMMKRFDCPDGLPFVTKEATRWHKKFIVDKTREKGMKFMRLVIELFVTDSELSLKKIDCPIAFLKSRWDKYDAEAAAEEQRTQDPTRWREAVDFMEGYGETPMSESQKEQVQQLAAQHGTGHVEDAYGEYLDSGASGPDDFLADPIPYLEAAA